MDKIKQFNELKSRFPKEPSIIIDSFENQLTLDEWQQKNKPHSWVNVENINDHSVWIDCSYGLMALFSSDEFIVLTHGSQIICENVVVLDKDYYGTDKYIWL